MHLLNGTSVAYLLGACGTRASSFSNNNKKNNLKNIKMPPLVLLITHYTHVNFIVAIHSNLCMVQQ
jgi:hypothetical protein